MIHIIFLHNVTDRSSEDEFYSANRRQSDFGLPTSTPREFVRAQTPRVSATTEVPKVSIVVTATEIAESDKLKHITIKSIKWLITEKYAGYLTTPLDKSKRLYLFTS